MTPDLKAAHDKFTQAGRELFLALNITAEERGQATMQLVGENIQDWVDDDIFLASYIFDQRECDESDAL